MEYLIVMGDAEELQKSMSVFLNDGWELYGPTFVTGKNVLFEATSEQKLKNKDLIGTMVKEFAQVIIRKDNYSVIRKDIGNMIKK